MYEVDRTRRVAELLKREIAVLIARELNDSRINSVTVTGVTISRDLKISTVFVSSALDSLNRTDQESNRVEKLLNKSAGYLRHLLSQTVNLRTTPSLVFKYDNSIQRGMDMSRLIDRLNGRDGG